MECRRIELLSALSSQQASLKPRSFLMRMHAVGGAAEARPRISLRVWIISKCDRRVGARVSVALANAAEVSVGERAVSIQMRIILALSEQIKVHAVL